MYCRTRDAYIDGGLGNPSNEEVMADALLYHESVSMWRRRRVFLCP